MSVEQFAGIVGVVAGILEPDWKPRFVEALADKFRIAAYIKISSDIQR